jgi:hypothetical protein
MNPRNDKASLHASIMSQQLCIHIALQLSLLARSSSQRPKTLLALPDLSCDVNTVSKNIIHDRSYKTHCAHYNHSSNRTLLACPKPNNKTARRTEHTLAPTLSWHPLPLLQTYLDQPHEHPLILLLTKNHSNKSHLRTRNSPHRHPSRKIAI